LEITTQRLVPTEERFRSENIAAALAGKRGAAVHQTVIATYPEFAANAPTEMNITQAKAYLAEQIARLPNDQFVPMEAPLPSGISSSITALVPEPIYIPAVKNFADDLKTTQTTSFGRLLGLLLEDMTPDLAEINQSLEQLNGLFNRVLVDGGVADGRHDMSCTRFG
jgi:putative ATP-dependent endonuclease of OLD family